VACVQEWKIISVAKGQEALSAGAKGVILRNQPEAIVSTIMNGLKPRGGVTHAPRYALEHPQLFIIIPAILFNSCFAYPEKMILHRSLDARHNRQLNFVLSVYLFNSKVDQCQIIILFTDALTNNFPCYYLLIFRFNYTFGPLSFPKLWF